MFLSFLLQRSGRELKELPVGSMKAKKHVDFEGDDDELFNPFGVSLSFLMVHVSYLIFIDGLWVSFPFLFRLKCQLALTLVLQLLLIPLPVTVFAMRWKLKR